MGEPVSKLTLRLRKRAGYPGDGCTLSSDDRFLLHEAASALEQAEKALEEISSAERAGMGPYDLGERAREALAVLRPDG